MSAVPEARRPAEDVDATTDRLAGGGVTGRLDELDRLTPLQQQTVLGWLASAVDEDTWTAALREARR